MHMSLTVRVGFWTRRTRRDSGCQWRVNNMISIQTRDQHSHNATVQHYDQTLNSSIAWCTTTSDTAESQNDDSWSWQSRGDRQSNSHASTPRTKVAVRFTTSIGTTFWTGRWAWGSNRHLTNRIIRREIEKQLQLEDGLLEGNDYKQRLNDAVKEAVVSLQISHTMPCNANGGHRRTPWARIKLKKVQVRRKTQSQRLKRSPRNGNQMPTPNPQVLQGNPTLMCLQQLKAPRKSRQLNSQQLLIQGSRWRRQKWKQNQKYASVVQSGHPPPIVAYHSVALLGNNRKWRWGALAEEG